MERLPQRYGGLVYGGLVFNWVQIGTNCIGCFFTILGRWSALLTWPIVALLALAAVWVIVFARVYRQAELPPRAGALAETHYPFYLCVLAVITALLLAAGVIALRAFPNSGDEYAYLFQAETFHAGRLWNVLPPVPDVFVSAHVLAKDGKWVSQYPPGWPIIIAGVTSLGLPAYVASPATALLLLFGFARLIRELVGPGAALAGTALLACCPFFLLNGASYFSHMPAALFGVLAVLCGVRFLNTGSIPSALGAGAALGFLGIIRPFSAVLIAIPCAIELLRRARSLHYRRLAWFFLGSFPFVIGFLFYNNAVTGSPLLDPTSWDSDKFPLGLQPVDEWGRTSAGFAIFRLWSLRNGRRRFSVFFMRRRPSGSLAVAGSPSTTSSFPYSYWGIFCIPIWGVTDTDHDTISKPIRSWC